MNRPPLREVARLASVSEPTVSRVLNGRTGVSAATRDRVIAVLEDLGFTDVPEPQIARRSVIGMVCGDFLNPVFATFVHYISTELGRRGYLTTVAVTDENLSPEERCISEFVDTRVDGVIFIGGRHAEVDGDLGHYRRLAETGLPMVLVNGTETGLAVPHVICDEAAGARQAVTHLIRLGHTRIGCVLGPPRFIPTVRFIDGYRDAMAAAGLPEPEGAIIDASFTLEGGRAGAARLLDSGITALIAGNDLMALGAMQAASGRPGDEGWLSVVGYDGTEFTAFTNPALTTMRQPFQQMAAHVCDAIVSEIDGSQRFRDQFVFQPQLLLRETTRPLRTTRSAVAI